MLKYYSAPRKKAAHPESRLQKLIVQHLLMNGAFYFSIPNEGKRSLIAGYELNRMGRLSGVADLAVVVEGKIFFMEVKSLEGRQSPAQIEFEGRCKEEGIPYACVNNLTDALKVLSDWRAIKTVREAAA